MRTIALIRLVLIGAAAFAPWVATGLAGAAELQRLAQLGLVPPATGAKEPAVSRPDPRHPGLKIPRSIGQGLALVRNRDANEPVSYGGLRQSFQLGVGTSRIVGGMLYPLSGDWYTSLEASADTASALPSRGYGLLGQVHRILPGGWDVSLGLHYNTYDARSRQLSSAGQESPLYGPSWALSPAATNISGTAGYELRLSYRYGERNTLGVTYGSGSELDYTRLLLGVSPADGRQFGLTGEHWLTEDWALNYGVMAQEQIGPNRGQGLRLGLRYRF